MAVDKELLTRYIEAQAALRTMIKDDIETFLLGLDTERAVEIVRLLEDFIPDLVEEYGHVASVVALDYYRRARAAAGIATPHTPVLATAVTEHLGPNIGWAAETLFGADASTQDAADRLVKVADAAVKETGTATFTENARTDKTTPKYARVPEPDACDWCKLLGSRGFAYPDEHTATFGKAGDKYHDHCKCEPVADWDVDNPRLEGYDEEALYAESTATSSTSKTKDKETGSPAFMALTPDQLEHQLKIMKDLPDTDWKRKQTKRVKDRLKELS